MIKCTSRMLVSALTAVALGLVFTPGCNTAVESASLTAAQQGAINEVVAQMETMASGLGSFADLVNPQTLATVDSNSFGECPVVTVVRDGTDFAITFDYGDGCTNDRYGNLISGQVTATLSLGTLTASVTLVDVEVDSQGLSGSATVSLAGTNGVGMLEGEVDFTGASGGSISGSLQFTLSLDTGIIVVTEATLTVSPAGDDVTYVVTVSDVVIDPLSNGNFIPESGTIAFTVPNEGLGPDTVEIVVTFTAQSPADGTVQVSVAGTPAVAYQIPGV